MKKFICFFLIVPLFTSGVFSQDKAPWHEKNCAVVLTYDDALNVDLDNAIPALDSLKLKATFYVVGGSPILSTRIAEWKAVAKKGHELGNHSSFHPCTSLLPGRGFVSVEYDLNNYTVRRMIDEISLTNTLLNSIDGKTNRTFAYPCGDTKIHDTSYIVPLRTAFTGARGVKAELQSINDIDLYNINCFPINGQTGDQLTDLVKQAIATRSLLVFLFHGVGGEHNLNVSLQAHSQLLHFLKAHENDIWIAPMTTIAEYIKNYQSKTK